MEAAAAALAHQVVALVALEMGRRLAPDSQDIVLDGHIDVVRSHAGQGGPDDEIVAVGHHVKRGGPGPQAVVVIARCRAEPSPHPVHGVLHLP